MTSIGLGLHAELPVAESARRAEALGFDRIACGEHLLFHGPVPNAFVTLAVAAGATQRLRLLSSVSLLALYPPVLAAKLVAELAVHSGGRFELGVGVGGEFAPEFEVSAVPVAERGARTDDSLDVVGRLLREEHVSVRTPYTRFDDVTIAPRPAVPPRVVIGGRGKPALRRAARVGDAWLPYMVTPAQLTAGLAEIGELAAAAGRAPDAVGGVVWLWGIVDSSAQAEARAAAALEAVYATDMTSATKRYVVAGPPSLWRERIDEFAAAGAEAVVAAIVPGPADATWDQWEALAAEVLPASASSSSPK